MLDGTDPVRIGLPLDGWDLAVVDAEGHPVAEGETGELIIGGVGLARYLDPAKDAEKYAPMPDPGLGPRLPLRRRGPQRPGRAGLRRPRRRPDQARRAPDRARRDRRPAAPAARRRRGRAAVRSTKSGNQLLVGYLTVDDVVRRRDGRSSCSAHRMPAALVPRLAVVDSLPTRTSGKVDRDALPWPLPGAAAARVAGRPRPTPRPGSPRSGTTCSAPRSPRPSDDFFDFGGGSLTAAQVVSRLRERFPEVAVGDLYAHPTRRARSSAALEELGGTAARDRPRGLSRSPARPRPASWPPWSPLRALAAAALAELAGARLARVAAAGSARTSPGCRRTPCGCWS